MTVTVLAVGKIKERWIQGGIDEYAKRLSRFGKLRIVEVPDESVPDRASKAQERQAMEREGQRLLDKWPKGAWGIALCPQGKMLGSEGLAKEIDRLGVNGHSHIVFVIGGSHGLSDAVFQQCRRRLSFGPNTFPHQLFRLLLLEQIYRAAKINAGEAYHK